MPNNFCIILQMKNNVRRGLFHPDDIKIIGLSNVAPGPVSAPLPSLSRKPSRPSISPLGSIGPSSASSYTHSRTGSLATPGSFGHAEAKKLQNQTEFGKYTEDDEEDYEDVFGKPNATCELAGLFWGACGADSTLLQPPSILCRLCN